MIKFILKLLKIVNPKADESSENLSKKIEYSSIEKEELAHSLRDVIMNPSVSRQEKIIAARVLGNLGGDYAAESVEILESMATDSLPGVLLGRWENH